MAHMSTAAPYSSWPALVVLLQADIFLTFVLCGQRLIRPRVGAHALVAGQNWRLIAGSRWFAQVAYKLKLLLPGISH